MLTDLIQAYPELTAGAVLLVGVVVGQLAAPLNSPRRKNICPRKKLVFIHIPKTGGTTLTSIFLNRTSWTKHVPITEYQEHYEYYIFAFVRNPYLRIISIYRYYDNGGNQSLIDKRMFNKKICINEFLQHYNEKNIGHLRTQYSFLQDSQHINFIGRFENFERDVKYLCNKFEIEYTGTHHRRTPYRKDYVIGPELIDEISNKYDIDFTKYGYEKIKLESPMLFSEFLKSYSFESKKI